MATDQKYAKERLREAEVHQSAKAKASQYWTPQVLLLYKGMKTCRNPSVNVARYAVHKRRLKRCHAKKKPYMNLAQRCHCPL